MAMTTEGDLLPCRNPSCKSNGSPHPNCRCYQGLEDGGQVADFCSEDRPHAPECEYYAEGGVAKSDSILTTSPGQEALSRALKGGLFKGHHEASDAILGHSDPTPQVAAVLAHNGAPGLFKLASTSVLEPRYATRPKSTGEKAQKLLEGFGGQGEDHSWNKKGAKLKAQLPELMANSKENELGPMAEGLIGRDIHRSAHPFAGQTALHLLSNGATPDELEHGISYAEHIGKGVQKMDKSIDGIFTDKDVEHPELDLRMREKTKKFIDEGALIEEALEEGVPVHEEGRIPATEGSDPIAKHFPAHNTMIQAARARVNNYLNTLKPQPNQPGLLLDPSPITSGQRRTYDRAVDIANDPLSVLSHIKTGTITPNQIKDLEGMYPEIYQELSKKLTQKLVEDKAKGKPVPYRVRQSLSMFLGQPLDSTMTSGSIQRIQSVFAPKPPPQQQGTAAKTTKAPLTKLAQSSQTSSQALAARQLRDK